MRNIDQVHVDREIIADICIRIVVHDVPKSEMIRVRFGDGLTRLRRGFGFSANGDKS